MKNEFINKHKDLIKKISVEIIKIIAFILVFFIILQILSVTVFSETKATQFANNKADAYSFLKDEPNTIDIVAVGNSDVYSGFIPLELWREYGYTSTVCASIHQTIQESEKFMKKIYEVQSPKLVIIEADMFYEGEKNVNTLKNANRLDDFFASLDPEYFENDISDIFSVFKFHNYWQGGKDNQSIIPYNGHGYKYNTKVCKLNEIDHMQIVETSEPMSNQYKKQTDSLISLCKKNGSKVLILTLPSINSWNYERHNAIKQYAEEQNVDFIDLNEHFDDIGISMTNCFRDRGSHLNYGGAKAVTSYLGAYMEKNYSFENYKDNKKYQSWNSDLIKFDKFRNRKNK